MMKDNWLFGKKPKEDPPFDETPYFFRRCFLSVDGKKVLDYLRKITKERVLSADENANRLFYLEGQRALVSTIEQLVKKGEN